jgi:hypothetical protein
MGLLGIKNQTFLSKKETNPKIKCPYLTIIVRSIEVKFPVDHEEEIPLCLELRDFDITKRNCW